MRLREAYMADAAPAPEAPERKAFPVLAALAIACVFASFYTPRFLLIVPAFGAVVLAIVALASRARWRAVTVVAAVATIGVLLLGNVSHVARPNVAALVDVVEGNTIGGSLHS